MNPFKNAEISRSDALIVTMAAAVVVYLIWNVPALTFIAYPLRLFVTYVHEAGHSLMALLSGGEVEGFRVFSDGSGVAATTGGSRLLILPAGYLGAAFFGAALFYLVNTTHRARTIAVVIGVGLILFSLLYTIPGNFQLLALLIGLVGGILMIALGWRGSTTLALLVLNVLAILTAMHGVLDLVNLINHANLTMPTADGNAVVRNDAYAFAEAAGGLVPASIWAGLWAGLALLMIGAAVYFSLVRPMLHNAGKTLTAQTSNLTSLYPGNRKSEE